MTNGFNFALEEATNDEKEEKQHPTEHSEAPSQTQRVSILSALQEIQESLKNRIEGLQEAELSPPLPQEIRMWRKKIVRAYNELKAISKETRIPLLHN